VEVLLDRIDREQRRLQFALLPGTEPQATSLRSTAKKKSRSEEPRPAAASRRSGKSKTRQRNKKNKGR
jgi:ribonuclease R